MGLLFTFKDGTFICWVTNAVFRTVKVKIQLSIYYIVDLAFSSTTAGSISHDESGSRMEKEAVIH